jgi:tetrahydromethanopterin S-methyltransferase subunit G
MEPADILEHLRAIREDLREVRAEQREQRTRLVAIERLIGHVESEQAELRVELNARFDRVTDRLDRIERRLDLTEAWTPHLRGVIGLISWGYACSP